MASLQVNKKKLYTPNWHEPINRWNKKKVVLSYVFLKTRTKLSLLNSIHFLNNLTFVRSSMTRNSIIHRTADMAFSFFFFVRAVAHWNSLLLLAQRRVRREFRLRFLFYGVCILKTENQFSKSLITFWSFAYSRLLNFWCRKTSQKIFLNHTTVTPQN